MKSLLNKRGKKIIAMLLIILVFELSILFVIYKGSYSDAIDNRQSGATLEDNSNRILNSFSAKEKRQEIDGLIEELGPQEAYDTLVDRYEEDDLSVKHIVLHIAGEELFKDMDIAAMTVCDSSYSYGCYHGVVVSAILERGRVAIKEMDEICNKVLPNDLSCQHGIGHGILEYLGHGDLNAALSECTKLSWDGSLLGCQDGVFMEYNFRTLVVGESDIRISTREFDPKAPYEPCDDIDGRFRKACYYELPRWWIQSFNFKTKEATDLCSAIPNEENKRGCFMGFGMAIAGYANYEPERIIAICNSIEDSNYRNTCLKSSVWSMTDDLKLGNVGKTICDEVSREEVKECQESTWVLRELSGQVDNTL